MATTNILITGGSRDRKCFQAGRSCSCGDLGTKYSIDRLDLVIANAGIATVWPTVADASVEDMQEHYLVNVIGLVVLFQATLPLLSEAVVGKFAVMSSLAGTLGGNKRNFSDAVYGTTKAALNYISRKIHFENEKLVVLAIDPGWVRTKMMSRHFSRLYLLQGNVKALILGFEMAEIEIDDSI
ncbi:NAD(P)-binding protein [Acephala macrosclerotiorum]|nr:NAD(P)-binding protein [Acephala macrosclerotiorum]